MPVSSERDQSLLLDMLLAAQDARAFVTGMDESAFWRSRLHQNAVIRSLEIIGEAAGKVSPELREANTQIEWREIIGMRHRLIHGYAEVDLEIVWTVVRDKLDPLIVALTPLVPPDSSPNE